MLRTIVTMPNTRLLLVPVVLLVQSVAVHWAASVERLPAPLAFTRFPVQIGEWKMIGEDPITPEVASVLHADQLLSRNYLEPATNASAGAIDVNRYIVINGKQRAIVLYWYQTPRRAIAREWAAKLWLVADAVRDRRTDVALVRVTVWSSEGQDESATASAVGFVRGVYPLLRETLPR